MTINVILKDFSTGYEDIVEVKDVENRHCFEYIDNEGNNCEMSIYDNGLCFLRKCLDHSLELNLKNEGYAKIISPEGEVMFDTKVVDFSKNNDILVVRYIIDDHEREIKIIYRS